MPQQLAKGPGFALYSIMDFIVDNYVPVIDGLQERFEELESAILEYRPSRHTIEGLYESAIQSSIFVTCVLLLILMSIQKRY